MNDQTRKMQDLQQQNKNTYKSDIVFCIDGTGSMGGCIDAVKSKIEKVVTQTIDEQAKAHNAEFELRLRLVIFRDVRSDGDFGIESYEFDDDISAFVAKLQAVEAKGGGDAPESTLDGLLIALKSNWRDSKEAQRAIALFTDAPPLPKIEAITMEKAGHGELSAEGDADFIMALNDQVRAKVFLAGPADPVFDKLSKAMEFHETESESLADVDLDKWLELIFKTVTQSSVTIGMTQKM